MKADAHGGNRHAMSRTAGRDAASLLDFSVNVRPEGMPDFLRAALLRNEAALSAYPSPQAEEAREAAARRYGLPASRFVFGNGSNELIHALARSLVRRGMHTACVVEPAFSEYALACGRAGMHILRLRDQEAIPLPGGSAVPPLAEALAAVPQGSPIFLANPGNPSGLFRTPETLRGLMARRPDLLWVLDEAFVEYAGPEPEVSLLGDLPEQAVVLRSLTKFHALPGLRLGFLAAPATLAAAVQAELPVWNVNALRWPPPWPCWRMPPTLPKTPRTDQCPTPRPSGGGAGRPARRGGFSLGGQLRAFPLRAGPGGPQRSSSCAVMAWPCGTAPITTAWRTAAGSARRCASRTSMNGLPPRWRDILSEAQGRPASPRPAARPRVPALMLQGTSSNAGKSVLAAAFCRIFRQDGYDVAPFKAQNMSLNSGVTAAGDEMGRAQILQAQAARLDPEARMNPILLKPPFRHWLAGGAAGAARGAFRRARLLPPQGRSLAAGGRRLRQSGPRNTRSWCWKARAAPARSTSSSMIWSTCAWPAMRGPRCCWWGISTAAASMLPSSAPG